jgi:hypothetical protein
MANETSAPRSSGVASTPDLGDTVEALVAKTDLAGRAKGAAIRTARRAGAGAVQVGREASGAVRAAVRFIFWRS